jgi:hypothetical protein
MLTPEQVKEFIEIKDTLDFTDSIVYAIAVLGANLDDNMNEHEKSEHILKLWELYKYLKSIEKKAYTFLKQSI